MKILKYAPLFLTLLTNEQVLSQPRDILKLLSVEKTEVKQNKTVSKEKTILHPANTKGKIKPRLDAWSTGSFLTGSSSDVYGQFDMQLGATKGKKEIGAHIEYTSPENIIGAFKRSNPQFRESHVRNFLNKYTLLDPKNPKYKEIVKLFNDGKITEEEARKIGSLKDAVYYLPYLYRADNKEASLPGVFILHKYGSNFSYHDLTKKKEAKQVSQKPINVPEAGLRGLDSKLDTPENVEGVKEEKPDQLEEKTGIHGMSVDEKKTIDTSLFRYEAGIGYDSDEFVNLDFRVKVSDYIWIGRGLGVGIGKSRSVVTPTMNNFYGYGKEEISRYAIGVSAEIDINKYLAADLGLGIQNESKTVVEEIRRANGEVVSRNKDNYNDANVRFYGGLSYKVNKKLSLTGKVGYNEEDGYAGLMARYRF